MDTHTVIVGHGAQYGIIPGGVYYEQGQVDALLDSIREAVAAEREASDHYRVQATRYHGQLGVSADDVNMARLEHARHRAALDALLSGEG